MNLLQRRGYDLLVREIDLLLNTARRVQNWPHFIDTGKLTSILCVGVAMWMWTCGVMNYMRPITLR